MEFEINRSCINKNVLTVMERLSSEGFCVYIAGPAVRELIIGAEPITYRLAVTAEADDIKRIFKRCIIHEGGNIVTVVQNMTGYEIIPVKSSDGRTLNLRKAVSGYDCTADTLMYSEEDGIIDLYGGIEDIKAKVVRKVGTIPLAARPSAILKLIRAAAVLGYGIEQKTAAEIEKSAYLVRKVTRELVSDELNKILMSENPERFEELHRLGIMKYIMPELEACFGEPQRNRYHIYDVGRHIIKTVVGTPIDFTIRWAALMHDIGKPRCSSRDSEGIIHFYGHHRESVRIADLILRRLHMEQSVAEEILTLVEFHDVRIEPSYPAVKRMLSKIGEPLFEKLLILQSADNGAKNPAYLSDKLDRIEKVKEIYLSVVREGQPYKINDLVINARDLTKLRYRAGREIGDTLRVLLDEVIMNPALNSRQYLLSRAEELKLKRDNVGRRRKDVRI